jgi:predicted dienelactone hydrolase
MFANLFCKSLFRHAPWISILTIGGSMSLISAAPVLPAQKVSAVYGPLEISVSISEIETFAKSGIAPESLKPYLQFLSPKQKSDLQNVLQERLKVDTQSLQTFGRTFMGDDLLNRLSNIIQPYPGRDSKALLFQGIVAANEEPEGLTALSLFRHFPINDLRLNVEPLLQTQTELNALLRYRDTAMQAIAQEMQSEIVATPRVDFTKAADLRKAGPFTFIRKTLSLPNDQDHQSLTGRSEARQLEVEIYLPQRQTQLSPVVIISHGLGSAPVNYSYLAEHLASYGFIAALPRHIGSDTEHLASVMQGQALEDVSPAEFVDRPLDIKYLLNELTHLSTTDADLRGKINLQKIGIIGHSFGAYTALAVAGAELNWVRLNKQCADNQPTFNLSLILQCRAKALSFSPDGLSDSRIKAVIAVNPFASAIFGPKGVGNIKIPTMIVSSSHDILTPAIPEQVYPFLWLKTPHKYLALLVNAGHTFPNYSPQSYPSFSASERGLQSMLMGADPQLASTDLQALSIAFMQTYLSNLPDASRYLSPAYANYLSQVPIKLDLVRSLTPSQLEQAYGGPLPVSEMLPLPNSKPSPSIASTKEVDFWTSPRRWFQYHSKQILVVLKRELDCYFFR